MPGESKFLKKSHTEECCLSPVGDSVPKTTGIEALNTQDSESLCVKSDPDVADCCRRPNTIADRTVCEDSNKNTLEKEGEPKVSNSFNLKPSKNSFRFNFSLST